jgi:prepilin-type N-terminal cleavage/methylation domain-containing protein
MKPALSRRSNGMTLVEMMISMAAASLIMAGIILTYLACQKITSAGIAQLAIQAKARQAMDAILTDVRRSENAWVYPSYLGTNTFSGSTNSDAGAYVIFQIPTNTLSSASDLPYHHYYMGNLRSLGNGITNGTLYMFYCNNYSNLTGKSADIELVRGITNPDRVFDWINGVMNLNIRVADENDVDGKQIIYLRSAVAFRNKQ